MNPMKTILIALALTVLAAGTGTAQKEDPDRITVTLSDPSRPAFVKASLLNGSITVKGYSGKEVIVEVKTRIGADSDDWDRDDDGDSEKERARRKGMRRITSNTASITVEEDNNEVTIGAGMRGLSKTLDLVIQVPLSSDLKLNTLNEGNISVTGVKGEIEVSNLNGPITITNVTGSVVADALNDDIEVVFSGIDPKKSMSFSSLNGDIDVTLPADARATLKLKTDNGDIYSDFDMKMDNATTRVEDNDGGRRGGRYKVTLEKLMTGVINGGGSEMVFKNFNGNIYIRKGK